MGAVRLAFLFLIVGCGRLGFENGEGENATDVVEVNSPRAPDECEAIGSFATGFADAGIAVASSPSGASVFGVNGVGDLVGIDIGNDRTPSGVTVVQDGSFEETAASFVQGRMIVTGRIGSRALVYAVPSPIGAGTELANFGVTTFSKTALAGAGPDQIMATSCGQVDYNAFDSTWNPAEGTYAKVSPGTSDHIAITPMGSRALTAISLDTGCHFEIASDRATSETRFSAAHCQRSRLATDGVDQVAMVIENAGGVEVVIDAANSVSAAAALPVAMGSSPRVLHHAGRYWLSFLDESNNVVVGYVDNGTVLLRPLVDARATADGYELAVLDGSPWIIGVDPSSAAVYGRRLCERLALGN